MAILGALALSAACSSETGIEFVPSPNVPPTQGATPTPILVFPDSNFTSAQVIGRTFSGTGFSLQGDDGTQQALSVRITAPTSALATIGSDSYTLTNASGTSFESADGTAFLTIGTRPEDFPRTPDVLYFALVDAPAPIVAGARISLLVAGNETPLGNLPSGDITYTGGAVGLNTDGDFAVGTSTINVGFSTPSLSATLTGVNPNDPSASYELPNGTYVNGEISGVITGAGYAGALQGKIYGDTGDQAAGTFLLSVPGDGLVGTFGATN